MSRCCYQESVRGSGACWVAGGLPCPPPSLAAPSAVKWKLSRQWLSCLSSADRFFFLPQAAALAWWARQSLAVLSIQKAPISARLCPRALNASRFAGDAE